MPSDVTITHRERAMFPGSDETKGELAEYYAAMAPRMLPFLAGRPVSLMRCPQGRTGHCFYQKHHTGGFGPQVHTVAVAEKHGTVDDYLWLDSAEGLAACVQMGTIEFHLWGSRARALERPDRLVFDLDPDEAMDFDHVRGAAREIHDRLAERGLSSFAMLTGGKGIHVIAPLTPGHTWPMHRDFAKGLAQALAVAEPGRFVATMSKAKREGRIFIDWLRNQRGSTAIAPYSARARARAPVAAPVAWDELDDFDNAHPFSIRDAGALLERAHCRALRGWGVAEQRLP